MKIAIIGSRGYPYVYSGYETLVAELAPRLVNDGHSITIYCHKKLFQEKPKSVNGVSLRYIPSIESKIFSQLSHSFLSTIDGITKGFDVILYVNSANGCLGFLTKIFKIRTAINVDGLEWLRPKWKGLGAKVFYFTSKMATIWMDEIITDAEEMRQVYIREFKKDSTVIAYGANIRESQNIHLIKSWNIESGEYYLIVGRLIPDNNALLILFEFIKSNTKKKLVIVGDVPYNDKYASNIRQMQDDRIIFTGYVRDSNVLAELYHHCFVYFHGHEFGGTNPTLLKALAYGCAVLALDTVFSREVLNGNDYGMYFSKDKGSLASMIDNLETDIEVVKKYKQISRNRIKENYTWEKIASQYINILVSLHKTR